MTTEPVSPGTAPDAPHARDTLLFSDGPIERVIDRLGLGDNNEIALACRILVILAIAWLPLLLLALVEGRAWQGAAVPMLMDADVNARFLIALPALLIAGYVAHRRFPGGLARLRERRLLSAPEQAVFDARTNRLRRIANSGWLDAFLLSIVVMAAIAGRSHHPSALEMDTWYAMKTVSGAFEVHLTGRWLAWVSLPIFQFLMLRWFVRLLFWWYLIWRFSRAPLRLQPLHPDGAGGVGFLGGLTTAFMPWMFAVGTLAAGWIGNQILYGGAELPDFKFEMLTLACMAVLSVVGPLLLLSQPLVLARRAGSGDYGTLATHYAERFAARWLVPHREPSRDLLGSGDIQSLADLNNSFQAVHGMRAIPFGTRTVVTLLFTVLAPSAPLLLTMFSAEELLTRVLKMLI